MIRLLKEMVIIILGIFAVTYLIFPTLGVFELIPDAIPIIGNMDEAAATVIIINTLRYYGLDLSRLYGNDRGGKKRYIVGQVVQPPQDDDSRR